MCSLRVTSSSRDDAEPPLVCPLILWRTLLRCPLLMLMLMLLMLLMLMLLPLQGIPFELLKPQSSAVIGSLSVLPLEFSCKPHRRLVLLTTAAGRHWRQRNGRAWLT